MALRLCCALTAALAGATAALSVSTAAGANDLRAAKIQQMATQIKNEPRVLPVGGVNYPLYNGPMWIPGSLTTQIQQQELAAISNFRRGSNTKAVMLAAKWAKDFDTLEDYTAFYDDVAGLIEKPLAADNSDVAFGAQRLAIKGFIMRAVKTDEFLKKPHHQSKKWIAQQDLSLKDEQLAQVCGAGVTRAKIREQNKLFVSEYDQVSQYNDPKQPQKYVADVLGFFCFNSDKQQLLPVEIRVLQTGLAYTPFDTEEEWTLAKMALEAAEISYQNMQHMAETHAMTIPIRVEAYRTMSDEHPVFALLMRHVYADFALEALSAKMLLNVSTEVDKTFGWGASGAIRFLDNQMKNDKVYVSLDNDFLTDIKRRGLEHIPTHKYVTYGKMYWDAFEHFVKEYMHAYYPKEEVLVGDVELQNWAAACAKVPHLRGFPAKFESRDQLRKVMVHLIFQSAFKHHAMNGAASWHGVAMPYSVPALWKALPTKKVTKGEKLNLIEWAIPKELVPTQVLSPALFYRAIPVTETLLDAYRSAKFADEPTLFGAMREFETSVRKIDAELAQLESNVTQEWPSQLYRPAQLSYYTWI
ncbi:hypothetical protein PINS_up004285 [Pythium insidiosum]|nr:hypothetical protein PINS_up004285 [Pythium insidiosum]